MIQYLILVQENENDDIGDAIIWEEVPLESLKVACDAAVHEYPEGKILIYETSDMFAEKVFTVVEVKIHTRSVNPPKPKKRASKR